MKIRIADIDASDRLRPIDRAWAEVIAASYAEQGQKQPIEVRPAPAGSSYVYVLTFGGHRLEAGIIAGWEEIDANVVERDELSARLAEIDENLIRHELTALDRALFLAERKRVWEELHPETKHGGDRRRKAPTDQVANLATWRFSTEAAEKTGLAERTIRRSVALASAIPAELLPLIRETYLVDNASDLARLTKMPASAQRRTLAALRDGKAKSIGQYIGAQVEARQDTTIERLSNLWGRANARERRAFLAEIGVPNTIIAQLVTADGRRKRATKPAA